MRLVANISVVRVSRPARHAFTLVELLVVIAILGLLAGILLPGLAILKTKAKIRTAQSEMKMLESAIGEYDALYSHFPGGNPNGEDVTYGHVANGKGILANSDPMIVLTDLNTGINLNHARNPRQKNLFTIRKTTDSNSPGLSIVDNQFRDPWSHPYVITMDFNADGYAEDAFYSLPAVSQQSGAQGYHGLIDYRNNGSGPFRLHGPVMIWSLGLDGKADSNTNAKAGYNQDNILSWQ